MLNRFTGPYAVQAWNRNVAAEHWNVSGKIGRSKGFMVLHPYKLYPIPDWAKPGMEESLIESISWQTYRQNPPLWSLLPSTAFALIRRDVTEIAQEMVSRPWPYEKTPPTRPVPPAAGMSKSDRQQYFSIFAIYASGTNGSPKLMFPSMFDQTEPIVAFAQGEAFNWMEYNDSYGGYYTEKFDEVSLNTFNSLMACPRAWRLSTVGGWNWQPRLSVADSLSRVQPGSPVQEQLKEGGVTNVNPTSISTITLH